MINKFWDNAVSVCFLLYLTLTQKPNLYKLDVSNIFFFLEPSFFIKIQIELASINYLVSFIVIRNLSIVQVILKISKLSQLTRQKSSIYRW